jgi:hypothetical protein
MPDQFIDTNREIIRKSIKDEDASSVENSNQLTNSALDYFEMDGDHKHVRAKMKVRGAIGIRKTPGEAGYETYTKQRTAEKIDSGEMEVVTSGIGTKILRALSDLFTNPTQSWTYLSAEGEPLEDEVAELLAHREAGAFDTSLPQSDWISNAVGTGPLLISWSSGHLTYSPFSPACLYAKYHDFVLDNDEARGVDYKNLEDATVVVVETNSVQGEDGANQSQFLAFFGRSEEYPLGRMVQYTSNRWDGWPTIDDPNTGAIEYRIDSGEMANPLSWLASIGEGVGVEYPIVMIDGGISVTHDRIAPVSTSLYENCLEIDVAFSRLLKDALANALGTKAIKSGMTTHLPKTLTGAVHLLDGQDMQIHFVPNSNAQIAFEITKGQARAIAESHGVPGYMVISEPGAIPESGIAMAIRTQPLMHNRDTRIRLNKTPVSKIFDIERGLYQVHTGEPLLPGVKQVWNPGRFIMPEGPLEKTTRLKAALDAGAIDYVTFVRDSHDLATDKDAIEMIEMMQDEERAQYKPPQVQAQTVRPGLGTGIGGLIPGRPPRG